MTKHFKILLFFILCSSLGYGQNSNWFGVSYGKNILSGPEPGSNQNIIAVDNSGNCFYTGFLSGDILQFGTYTLLENQINYSDIFLVKFAPNGNVLWAKQSEQSGNQINANGYVVSTDGMGNAYIMANFTDTISFDSYILITQQDGYNNFSLFFDNFLVKYDPNGNVVWARQSQIPSYTSGVAGNSLATDRSGNSYITGLFTDTVNFGAKTIIGILIDTSSYTFLVKYDANGNVKWAAQSKGYSYSGSEGDCVATNNIDGIFVSGVFLDSVTFGSSKLTCRPTLDGNIFLVKYDTNGNVKWARAGIIPSSHNYTQSRGITADNFGNVYVTGIFWDTVIFGTYTLTTVNNNLFIVKYDSNGNVKWAMAPDILDNNDWGPTTLSSDNKGNVFLSGGGGKGLCKICFGNDTLSLDDTSNHDYPSFVVKFDSSGNVMCASILPCGGGAYNGIASDPSGDYVYLGGTALSEAIFGKDTLNPFTNNDDVPFVARWKECEPTLGVDEVKEESEKVRVYPNPSNGIFTFDFSTPLSGTIEIYDITGRMVYQEKIQSEKTEINIGSQPSGMYFYRAISNIGSLIGEGKVILQK